MLDQFLSIFPPNLLDKIGRFLLVSSPVWIALILSSICFYLYIAQKRREWILEQGFALLEIKLPKEVMKSPAAMEIVLSGIYEPVIGTVLDVFFKGKLRPWFSLEIVSLGGQVKFFIWCMKKWKNNVEARLYAQYPNIEIQEVPDYTQGVNFDPETMSMSSFQTALVKPDVYPIKTYVDWKLDKLGDEDEEKVDPITPLIEWLGSLKEGERCWIQIMIQAHRAEKTMTDVTLFPKKAWKDQVKKEIEKILKESTIQPAEGKKPTFMDLSSVQKETIDAIQRSQGKLAYDTMIRAIYFAKKENFNSMATAGMIHSFRHMGSANLNSIKPVFNGIDYPWQDFKGIRKNRYMRMIFDAYKRRSVFNGPYKNWRVKPYILNVEELATLFHFPSSIVASTPTLTRIPSKKAEAPSNLPI